MPITPITSIRQLDPSRLLIMRHGEQRGAVQAAKNSGPPGTGGERRDQMHDDDLFTCTVCGVSVCRRDVRHNAEGLPFCPRCFDLFGAVEFHTPGCPCCQGTEKTDAVIQACRELLDDVAKRNYELTAACDIVEAATEAVKPHSHRGWTPSGLPNAPRIGSLDPWSQVSLARNQAKWIEEHYAESPERDHALGIVWGG